MPDPDHGRHGAPQRLSHAFNRRARGAGWLLERLISLVLMPGALGAALLMAAGMLAMPDSLSDIKSASVDLTAGERALSRQFFSAIDPDEVKKYPEGNYLAWFGGLRGMAARGNAVIFFGPVYEDDFSAMRDVYNFTVFMHEMTHIWQQQNMHAFTRGRCPGDYSYALRPASRFSDFCNEEQAEIVADYARRFIAGERSWFADEARDSLLQRVVEEQFPGARVLRELT